MPETSPKTASPPESKEPIMLKPTVPNRDSLLNDAAPNRRLREDQAGGAKGLRTSSVGNGAETVIGPDTLFEGKVVAQGELRIDGTFVGEIASTHRVIVGTAGKIEATIEAKEMIVSGRVYGNLKILERLEILATGELFGDLDIQPGCLIIEKGARLEGRCSMGMGKEAARAHPPQAAPRAQTARVEQPEQMV
jgi:cytoskeletal protein CcmA (bactofilin family)